MTGDGTEGYGEGVKGVGIGEIETDEEVETDGVQCN